MLNLLSKVLDAIFKIANYKFLIVCEEGYTMELIVGVFLTVIGGIMLMKPKTIWEIKTNSEPTKLYRILIRIGGCILVIGGICAILQMQ